MKTVDSRPLRAFWSTAWREADTLILARSAGSARYQTLLSIWECGYKTTSFKDIRVKRAPDFDYLVGQVKSEVPLNPSHLPPRRET